MEIPIELPLDADGFLRRECPNCEQEFKWHHGRTDDAPSDFVYPDVYWCPLCGRSAGHDSWWTRAQLDYQQAAVANRAQDIIDYAFRDLSKPQRGSFIRFEVQHAERPGSLTPLVEPDDMMVVAPPCHPFEPVKVPTDSEAPYHCLVCGEPYAV